MKITHEGWTLFDYDMKLRRQVWVRDNGDGTRTFRTDYEVDPTIEINKAQRNMAQAGWKGDYHHVASIPLNIYYDQLHEAARGGDDRYMSKWLNDSSNRAWRTKDGRI